MRGSGRRVRKRADAYLLFMKDEEPEEGGRTHEVCVLFFVSVPSGPEPTSVSDGTGGSIVSEVISSASRGALCAGDRGRKIEVSWVGGEKEKVPV